MGPRTPGEAWLAATSHHEQPHGHPHIGHGHYHHHCQGECEGGRNCPTSRRIRQREKPSTIAILVSVSADFIKLIDNIIFSLLSLSPYVSMSSLNVSNFEAVFRNSAIFSLLCSPRWLPGCSWGLCVSLSSSDPLSPTTSPPFFFPHDGSGADVRYTGIFSHCSHPTLCWCSLLQLGAGQLAIRPGWWGWAGQWTGYEIYAVWRMSSHVSFNGPAGREGRRKKAVGRKEGRRPRPGGVGKGLSLSVSYCAKLSLAQL